MYNVVKSCISFYTSHMGLKQGDPSTPLLFMLFINDIVVNINAHFEDVLRIEELRIFMLLYADDAIVFAKSPTVLQSMLNVIELYCGT